MNKDFYNNCIKQYIQDLIETKESCVENIQNIATYINFMKDSQNLDEVDLSAINEERNNIGAIYQLIEDLEKLMK